MKLRELKPGQVFVFSTDFSQIFVFVESGAMYSNIMPVSTRQYSMSGGHPKRGVKLTNAGNNTEVTILDADFFNEGECIARSIPASEMANLDEIDKNIYPTQPSRRGAPSGVGLSPGRYTMPEVAVEEYDEFS